MQKKLFVAGLIVGVSGIVTAFTSQLFIGNADAVNGGRIAGIVGAVLVGISFVTGPRAKKQFS